MRVVAIIQARMGSSRLPGKVLMPLGDDTVLGCVIERLMVVFELDEVVVATTDLKEDDVVVEEAQRHHVSVFRGHPEDVLKRFHDCADIHQADVLVRITADCPLLSPELVSEMLVAFRNGDFDYYSNTVERSYPKGLDVEIFRRSALGLAHVKAVDPYEREHVTPFIYRNPEKFRLGVHKRKTDLSEHRWTIDTPKDYEFVSFVYESLLC